MATEFVNIQEQQQSLEQQQRLTARQVAYMRMLEMPLEDLREKIEKELEENVALEKDESSDNEDNAGDTPTDDDFNDNAPDTDNAPDNAPDGLPDTTPAPEDAISLDQGTLDEIEYFESDRPQGRATRADGEEYSFDDPDVPQFHDMLKAQVGEYTLTPHQRSLLEYLIGSLEDTGLLKKKLYVIADELEVYAGIQTTTGELEEILRILQQFDPPGIGARTLQECLLIQIDRRIEEKPDSSLWPRLRAIVDVHWDNLTHNRWDVIRRRAKISEGEMRSLQRLLRTLTPSPGLAPGEAMSTSGAATSIIPDFTVEVGIDGVITVQLNEPGIPTLRVSPHYEALARSSVNSIQGSTPAARREAHDYVKGSVMRAKAFMTNVRNRHTTMLRIMREIVAAQRDYFLTGDELLLRPLMMKEVAEATTLDISIISRAASNKWVDTPHGMRPVRWFFRGQGGVTRDDGTQLEQDRLLKAVADEIAAEDKRAPYSDDKLAKILQSKGYPLARRTVAKYREIQGIPVARLRQIR